jgi:hypothetical protein
MTMHVAVRAITDDLRDAVTGGVTLETSQKIPFMSMSYTVCDAVTPNFLFCIKSIIDIGTGNYNNGARTHRCCVNGSGEFCRHSVTRQITPCKIKLFGVTPMASQTWHRSVTATNPVRERRQFGKIAASDRHLAFRSPSHCGISPLRGATSAPPCRIETRRQSGRAA